MHSVGQFDRVLVKFLAIVIAASTGAGCVTSSDGPTRLYSIEEETTIIKAGIAEMSLAQFSRMNEEARFKYRNDWIGARMYAIDIQYTAYQSALTRERQTVGFGAAAATLGLTTASGLVAPVATKNLLTGLAGFVTGTRAAYDNDVLLAHSVQWIQSQMQAKRTIAASRLLNGIKLSTSEYPLAAALSDLEEYYRAGTFTGGLISTSEVIAADAQSVEEEKQATITVPYGSNASTAALRACAALPNVNVDDLIRLAVPPEPRAFSRLFTDVGTAAELRRNRLLAKARQSGICP